VLLSGEQLPTAPETSAGFPFFTQKIDASETLLEEAHSLCQNSQLGLS
jgi:hypothetical protein